MSNRIPNFGWNRLKLATLTYEQLAQLEEQVKADHACQNGIHLFDKAGQRKLDALSWAVYNKQKAERAACQISPNWRRTLKRRQRKQNMQGRLR